MSFPTSTGEQVRWTRAHGISLLLNACLFDKVNRNAFEAKVTLLPRDARARGDVLVAQTQERQPFLSLRRADTFPLPPSISDLLIIETQRTPTSFLTAVVSQTHVSMDHGDKCPLDTTRLWTQQGHAIAAKRNTGFVVNSGTQNAQDSVPTVVVVCWWSP